MRCVITPLVLAALAAPVAGCGSSHVATGAADPPVRTPPQREQIRSLQQQFVDLVKSVSPSVVQISTRDALGSGVVFDGRGDIVTNAHVVGSAMAVLVTLQSGERDPGVVLGRDVGKDVAVIRVVRGHPHPATFADSSRVQVGDIVVALGNPLGLRSSVTQGIVSAVGRSVSEGNGVTLSSVIQTSAEINPGNSGGALVDLSGQVIGIPTLAALDPELDGSQAPGIGFAIDSNTVRRVATELVSAR